MDILVNAISSGPAVRTRSEGPAVTSRRTDTPSPERTQGASVPVSPAEKGPVTAVNYVPAPGQNELIKNEKRQMVRNELPENISATGPTIKRFEFVHDEVTGMSVVKFMDSKGNVILQVPPEFYLRTVQILMEYGGVDLQSISPEPDTERLTGMLYNNKV